MVRELVEARNNKGLPEVKKLILGKDVTTKAFTIKNYFPELQEIQVVPENPNFMSKDGVLFDKAGITLVAYPAKAKDTYVVPEGTEIIDVYAFSDTSIKKVEIPKSVQKIRPDAFRDSTLESIKMVDNSVTYIGLGAFTSLSNTKHNAKCCIGGWLTDY